MKRIVIDWLITLLIVALGVAMCAGMIVLAGMRG